MTNRYNRNRERTKLGAVALAGVLLGAALVVAAQPAAAHAASHGNWPYQSQDNKGTDVKTIQWLLEEWGYDTAVDGFFGPNTADTVAQFQSDHGLTSDGIVGANTWDELVSQEFYSNFECDPAVNAIQYSLNHKFFEAPELSVDGCYGSNTESAVADFQNHMGITVDGVVGPETWKELVWHFERPNFASDSRCHYGDWGDEWGTGAAVGQLEQASAEFLNFGHGPMAIGDISLEHGGDISGHGSHEEGLDADLRPIRTDEAQCSFGTNVHFSSYSEAKTRDLIAEVLENAGHSSHVQFILFNDADIVADFSLVIPDSCTEQNGYAADCSHDNHLHVRYCEVWHVDSSYDC